MNGVLQKIQEIAQKRLCANADGHDWDHTLRVRKNALEIGGAVGADLLVLEIAALLHDIARPEESRNQGKTDHALLGAEEVKSILPAVGLVDQSFIQHVSDCVLTHRYRRRSGMPEPASLEAKVLYDADKLDSLGAIGVARALHFSGHIGSRVHNSAEEALAAESYSHEDSAYREYLVKLRHLPERMLTVPGREIALRRAAVMEAFFRELTSETGLQ